MNYAIQTSTQLGAHLRGLREARGMSQAELGRILGVNQPRIARIEAEPGSISVEQFIRLLSALGVQLVLSPVNQQNLKVAESSPPYNAGSGRDDW